MQDDIRKQLPDLTDLIMTASKEPSRTDRYTPACMMFCDGIEFKLGVISLSDVSKTKTLLKNELQS